MKIFVTGGTGFIGKPTTRELLRRGHTLFLLTANVRKAKSLFKKNSRLRFFNGDLETPHAWGENVTRFKPDAVLHLAWEGIPDYGPEQSMKNLAAGLEFIRFTASLPRVKIVCAGSSWEYGVSAGETREGDGIHPVSAFTAAKTAIHWIGREIAQAHGAQFIWTRIFYAYGPGQKPTSLIPHIARTIRAGGVLALKNPDGANDFVYVEDVARAFCMLIEKKIPAPYAVYNIASGGLTSVRDIVRIASGRKASLSRPKKTSGFWADISKIKKEIGWSPRVPIRAGIKKTVAYFKKT